MTARRIDSLDSYLFHQLAQAKKDSKRKLIDLGAGDPDLFPPERIIERLKREVEKPENHRHPVYEGLPELKQVIAEWFYKRFKIKLDSEKEVLVLAGSKEGLGLSSWAFLNRGEEALIPDPSYPVYRRSVLLCCGKAVFYPLTEEKDWLLDLGKIKATPKTKLLYLNYPHNPTGAVLDLDFLEKIYEFARKQKLVILNDMAYSEITYDGYTTPSLLQIRGAKNLCLEFFSFSKTYSMSGWRLGFAVGNKNLIDALFKVKVTSNSGVFHPIQKAGIEALSLPTKELLKIKDTYRKRRDILVDGLMKLGWEIRRPKGTIFCWAKIPGYAKFKESKRFCLNLIKKGYILTTPGAGFGKSGEGYVRFSLTSEIKNIKLALKRMKEIDF